jgi:hypothetical protein
VFNERKPEGATSIHLGAPPTIQSVAQKFARPTEEQACGRRWGTWVRGFIQQKLRRNEGDDIDISVGLENGELNGNPLEPVAAGIENLEIDCFGREPAKGFALRTSQDMRSGHPAFSAVNVDVEDRTCAVLRLDTKRPGNDVKRWLCVKEPRSSKSEQEKAD